MAKINPQLSEETKVDIETLNPTIYIGNTPTFIAGLTRKINMGNFEAIDISATISLPMPAAAGDIDIEILRQVVKDTASEAFTLVAQEVSKRHEDLKAMRSAGRGRQEEATE